MPLILSRKKGQTITVAGPCVIRVVAWTRRLVQLEIVAEDSVRILRGELDRPGHAIPPKIGGKLVYPPMEERE
jgi:sRNA-binding carbon storage regulator CsrA